mgnify:CR=1 FL=1
MPEAEQKYLTGSILVKNNTICLEPTFKPQIIFRFFHEHGFKTI